jgi:hypothetical protein
MVAARLPVLSESTWRRMVEDLHVEFGLVVVTRWQLPDPIREVIANHHTPHHSARAYTPLVQLVEIVDQIIAVLDRGGQGGSIAALQEVPGLEQDERYKIGALMPKVAEQMAKFETPPQREAVSSIAPSDSPVEDGWPVDFPIASKTFVEYRAVALTHSTFAFRSQAMLQPAWLAELTLHCDPDKITMLANVKSCQNLPAGDFLVTAQPFGLAGDDKNAWLRLIERARRATQK